MGYVYQWTGAAWEERDPVGHTDLYISCFRDGLDVPELTQDVGWFGALFAARIVALKAFIETLEAQLITLKPGGMIESEGFDGAGGSVPGFRLTAANGLLEAVSAVFRNITITGDSHFAGGIVSGPLIANNNITGQTTAPTVFSSSATARDINNYFGVPDTYDSSGIVGNVSVTSGSFGNRGGLTNIAMTSKGLAGYRWYYSHKTVLSFADGGQVVLEWVDVDGSRNTIGQVLSLGGGIPGRTLIITQVPSGDAGLDPGTLYTDPTNNILRIKR